MVRGRPLDPAPNPEPRTPLLRMHSNPVTQQDTARAARQEGDGRVYTSLHDLLRLQHLAVGFSFLPRQPIHSLLAGRHASRLRGRGLNFEELRHYRSGDDVRTIDWKATNRTRKPQVRVFTEERDRPVLLLVDQRRSMFFGSRRSMKSVAAAEVAALGAWRVLDQGDRVGALVFNDRDCIEIRPHRSRARVLRILETVVHANQALSADMEVPPNPGMLNQVLGRASRLAGHDALVCLVSDFSGAEAETRDLMTRLAVHNDVMAVLVADEIESRLPAAGHLVFAEAGDQLEINTSDERLRKRYAEAFTDRVDRIRNALLKRAVPLIPIDAGLPVADQLRRHIGQAVAARQSSK